MRQISVSPVSSKGGGIALWLSCLLMFAAARALGAAPYEISWHTIDSGGGTSSGGPYKLTGTIGQPDAGWSNGGKYELLSGFWPARPVDCFPSAYSTYNDWLVFGKPACWCSKYQCDGDADGATEGSQQYRIGLSDVGILIDNWKREIDDPSLNACADIDHKSEGSEGYRVFINDLNILITNWKKTDADIPGDCPRPE